MTANQISPKQKRNCLLVGTVLLVTVVLGLTFSDAAQVIYIDILDFIPEKSEFILDEKEREAKFKEIQRAFVGHVWRIIEDKDVG